MRPIRVLVGLASGLFLLAGVSAARLAGQTIIVTPENSTVAVPVDTTGYELEFSVEYSASGPDTIDVVLDCLDSVVICGSISPSSLRLAPGQWEDVTVTFSAPTLPGDGEVMLEATGDGQELLSDVGRYYVKVRKHYDIRVEPRTSSPTQYDLGSTGHVRSFRVENYGLETDTFTAECRHYSYITNCRPVSTGLGVMSFEDTVIVADTFDITASGVPNDYTQVGIEAYGTQAQTDTRRDTVQVVGPSETQILNIYNAATPTYTIVGGTAGHVVRFTIENSADSAVSVVLQCQEGAAVASCTPPGTFTLNANSWIDTTVVLAVQDTTTESASIVIGAYPGEGDEGSDEDTVSFAVKQVDVSVDASIATMTVAQGATVDTTVFQVHNTGTTTWDFTLTPTYTLGSTSVLSTNPLNLSDEGSSGVRIRLQGNSIGSAYLYLVATGSFTGGSVSARDSILVEVVAHGAYPSVAPKSGDTTFVYAQSTVRDSVRFTVSNTGDSAGVFTSSCQIGGSLSNCAPASRIDTLVAGQVDTIWVTFDVTGADPSSAGLGTLVNGSPPDTGSYSVNITSIVAPFLSAVEDTVEGRLGVADTVRFEVNQANGSSRQYALSCSPSCAVVSPTSPAGIGSTTQTVKVLYTPTGPTAVVQLEVEDVAVPSLTAAATSVVKVPGPQVVPAELTPVVAPGADTAVVFNVSFLGNDSRIGFAVDCGGFTGCTTPDSITIGESSGMTSVPVGFTAGSNGTSGAIRLTATLRDQPALWGDGVANVQVASLLISLSDANPGLEELRGECVGIAAGAGSIQCDDYVYAYPFAPVKRMNRMHGLSLLYSSATSASRKVVGANVQIPEGESDPSSVFVRLLVDGEPVDSATYEGDVFSAGDPVRVSFAIELPEEARSRLVPYEVQAKAWFGSDSVPTVGEESYFVNVTRQEEFGRGWWPAGYERLVSATTEELGDTLLWIGGDGSARAYFPVDAPNPTIWAAFSRGVADTIVAQGDSTQARYLDLEGSEGGTRAAGQHSGLMGVNKLAWGFWIRPDGHSGRIGGVYASGDPNRVWWFEADNNGTELMMVLFNTAAGCCGGEPVWRTTTGGALADSTWKFVVVQYDGTQGNDADRLKVWVNGSSTTVTKPDWAPSYDLPTQLASSSNSPFEWGKVSAYTPGFRGWIGETAIVGGVLADSVRSDWYQNGIDWGHDGLVAGYDWAGDLIDRSPQGNDLTAAGINSGHYGTTTGYVSRGAVEAIAYERQVLGGGRVQFDSKGRHLKTIDRNGNQTTFSHTIVPGTAEKRLTTVAVPTPSGPSPAYLLAYDSATAQLNSVEALGGDGEWLPYTVGGTALGTHEFRIDQITAPDGLANSFTYDTGGLGRMESVTDHRGAVTSVGYTRGKVSQVQVITTDPAQTATMSYKPYSLIGVDTVPGTDMSPMLKDSVSAAINGVRTDVQDTTRFFVTHWGAVSGIRDALGNETWLERLDANFPSLVTQVLYPNLRRVTTDYVSTTGLPGLVTEYAEVVAETQYEWDPTWRQPTWIRSPEQLESSFAYDASNGNRTRSWVGSDTVTFHFDAYGLPDSVRSPEGRVAAFTYDSLGNVSTETSPGGTTTTYTLDYVGRTLEVSVPTAAGGSTGELRDTNIYDDVGRLLSHRTWNTLDGAAAWDSTEYNAVGDRVGVSRAGFVAPGVAFDLVGDSVANGVDVQPLTWAYDQLGRVKSESSNGGTVFEYRHYDVAGNVERVVTRRGDTISMSYDAVNRMKTRSASDRSYPAVTTVAGAPPDNPPQWQFPFVASAGGGRDVIGDSVSFAYDQVGNLRSATNASGFVMRSYSLRGELVKDSVRVFSPAGSSNVNTVVSFQYDRDGRIKELRYPGHTSGFSKKAMYGYDPTSGRLDHVVNMLGDTVRYEYDRDGRVEVVRYPGSLVENLHYDDDGRLVDRNVGAFFHDSLEYDPAGRVVRVLQDPGSGLATMVENVYDGLGHLTGATDYVNGTQDTQRFLMDGLGNEVARWNSPFHAAPTSNNPLVWSEYYTNGRLRAQVGTGTLGGLAGPYPRYKTLTYEINGDVKTVGSYEQETDANGAEKPWVRASAEHNYYDAEGRLRYRQSDTRVRTGDPLTEDHRLGAWEEYRYDALGRRVATLTLADGLCTTNQPSCYSAERLFVWAGAQIAFERSRLPSGALSKPGQYGTVYYTHAGGVDKPISVVYDDEMTGRFAFFPHVNWRGLYVEATDTAGQECDASGRDCFGAIWPGTRQDAFRSTPRDATPSRWFGSLMADQQDVTGLLSRRNRYYDASTGLFTQEDPIGIAGGLNLYGYANGDPINLSDPFGLCAGSSGDTIRVQVDVTCPDGSKEKRVVEATRASSEQVGVIAGAASSLAGGSGAVTPGAVATAYQPVLEAGNIYVYPAVTADGGIVTTGGQTQSWPRWMFWTTPRVAFNARLLGAPTHGLFFQTVGHEGAHLVNRALGLGLTDPQVDRIPWRAR